MWAKMKVVILVKIHRYVLEKIQRPPGNIISYI